MPHEKVRSIYSLIAVFMLATILLALPVSALGEINAAHCSEGHCPLISCSANPSRDNAHRQVIQIIEGEYYKWSEFNSPGGTFSIYLHEPVEKPLNKNEAYLLLEASRQWQFQTQTIPDSSKTISSQVTFHADLGLHREEIKDDRTVIAHNKVTAYPYHNVGFLNVRFPDSHMRSTAFLVAPHLALTNAHNIYASELGGWFEEISFSPAQYETNYPEKAEPYSSLNPLNAEISDRFFTYKEENDQSQAVKYDYAALFFEESFSGITTFMPLEFNYIPDEISVIGYPGIVNGKDTYDMWRSEGKLIDKDDYLLYYNAFTSGGNSGSPVIVYNSQANSYRVVAIHTFASINMISGGPHLNNKNKAIIEDWFLKAQEFVECPLDSISLSKENLTLEQGERKALVATYSPEDAAGINLTWESSNPGIAEVDANGVVKEISPGAAEIVVAPENKCIKASCNVTVIASDPEHPGSPDEDQVLSGDVNGDGKIDVLDVVLLVQHALELSKLDDNALYRADVNRDGRVDVRDASIVMRYALGLIDSF